MAFFKRALDISLAAFGLFLSWPVLLIIAFFVRLESPGSVIFSQKRLGRNGKYFYIHKFRKFPADWGTKGAGVTLQGDVRMTSVGTFLERTKLDELPQLWNILKGEMSFVGPRPESARYETLFVGDYRKLMNFKPGIFGPNQVKFRNEAQMYPDDQDPDEFYKNVLFPQKAMSDIDYFENSNLISDIGWIFKGIFGTISGTVNWRKFFNQHGVIIVTDIVLFQIAWFVSHLFRFGFPVEGKHLLPYQTGVWLIPLLILPLMHMVGCYRHPVRYFSVSDLSRLLVTVSALWMFATLIEIYFFHRYMSISVSTLGLFLFLGAIIALRTIIRERWLKGHQQQTVEDIIDEIVLIYGANKKGHALAKFLEQSFSYVTVAGFLDNDSILEGRFLNGRKVFGHWRDIDTIKTKTGFNKIWVCRNLLPHELQLVEGWSALNEVKVLYLKDVFSENK